MAKAVYASQALQAQQEDPQVAQQHAARAAAQQQVVDHSRTLPAAEAEEAGVRTDDHDQGQQGQQGQQGRRRTPAKAAPADDEDDGGEAGHIDVFA